MGFSWAHIAYKINHESTVDSRYNKLLGPSEITLSYQIFLYPVCKNNKIQRNFELWDQENNLISVLYNESPLQF